MIRDAETFDLGALSSPFHPRVAAPAVTSTTASAHPDAETAEREITRLTWAVLDGSASLADRQRLAELVNTQHAVRRRFDR